MSASLVGSEMCIRDRARDVGPIEGATAMLGVLRSNMFHRILTSQRPVSYTHLTLPTICSV
eukprot:98064-Alexandrium_andersonii.AAC.1